MLVDPVFHSALQPIDPMLNVMLRAIADGVERQRIAQGVYQTGHFNFDNEIAGKLSMNQCYPNHLVMRDTKEYFGCYGVCDNWQQITEQCPMLCSSTDRHFAISITSISKADQPASGGWRWHKWGPYIGTQEPTCEYIHDEPVIEQVYVYHVYQLN